MNDQKEKIFYIDPKAKIILNKYTEIKDALSRPDFNFKSGFLLGQKADEKDISFHGSPYYDEKSTLLLDDGKTIEQGDLDRGKIHFIKEMDIMDNVKGYLKDIEKEINDLLQKKQNISKNYEKLKNIDKDQNKTEFNNSNENYLNILPDNYKVFIGLKWCDVLIENNSNDYKDMFYEYQIYKDKKMVAKGIDSISFEVLKDRYDYTVEVKLNDYVEDVPFSILQHNIKENLPRVLNKPSVKTCSPILQFMMESCKSNEWGGSILYPADINNGNWKEWEFSKQDIIELKNEIETLGMNHMVNLNVDLINDTTREKELISLNGYTCTMFDMMEYEELDLSKIEKLNIRQDDDYSFG